MRMQHFAYAIPLAILAGCSHIDPSDAQSLAELGNYESRSVNDAGRVYGLDAVGESVTDVSAIAISKLTELTELGLYNTSITHQGLHELQALKKLQALAFTDTQLSEEDIDELIQLQDLRVLDLSRTGITDSGLGKLSKLSNLEILFLKGNDFTEDGVRKLRRELPRCRIQAN